MITLLGGAAEWCIVSGAGRPWVCLEQMETLNLKHHIPLKEPSLSLNFQLSLMDHTKRLVCVCVCSCVPFGKQSGKEKTAAWHFMNEASICLLIITVSFSVETLITWSHLHRDTELCWETVQRSWLISASHLHSCCLFLTASPCHTLGSTLVSRSACLSGLCCLCCAHNWPFYLGTRTGQYIRIWSQYHHAWHNYSSLQGMLCLHIGVDESDLFTLGFQITNRHVVRI